MLLAVLTPAVVQSTFGGYGLINQENVFKVCDQPHPLLVGTIIANCLKLKIDEAYDGMRVIPLPLYLRIVWYLYHGVLLYYSARLLFSTSLWNLYLFKNISHHMRLQYIQGDA